MDSDLIIVSLMPRGKIPNEFTQIKTGFYIALSRWENICWTLGTKALNIFATAFYVSGVTIWGKQFTEKLSFYVSFPIWIKNISDFCWRNLSKVLKSAFYVSKGTFGGKMFLYENWFLFTSHKNFALWAKKTQATAKTYRRCILRFRRRICRKVVFLRNYKFLVNFRFRANYYWTFRWKDLVASSKLQSASAKEQFEQK